MCILFIAVDEHPRYPLIIAANRDEYHARPSEPMRHWPEQPGTLAGRDRRAGGTWFGVNERGRVAAVTNHRAAGLAAANQQQPNQSRGELVARFLRDPETECIAGYGEFLRRRHHDFNPFNLIYGEAGRLHCFSSVGPLSRSLGSGFHSLSNGAPDDPWPKMSRGVSLLKARVGIASRGEISGEELAEQLAEVMTDQTTADDHLLPRTGIPPDREKHLSSIFITGEDYGTRTTTLLLGDGSGFDLYEHNYRADGTESGRGRYSLTIRPSAGKPDLRNSIRAAKKRKIPCTSSATANPERANK